MKRSIITLLLIPAMILCTCFVDARSESYGWNGGTADDLPGMSITTVIITGVVIAAAAVAVILIVKKASGPDKQKAAPADSSRVGLIDQRGLGLTPSFVMVQQPVSFAIRTVNARDDSSDSIRDRIHPMLFVDKREHFGFGVNVEF
ncbi:MAG: hypothetical protein ABR899_04165 [Candidatus Krumholzibacteriaceae bacterium]